MTKILVTGATGFIGTHLVQRLRGRQQEVFAANREWGDITDHSVWRSFPDAEVVIHLAGKTFVPESWIDPADFFFTNLHGTVCALNYCRERQARLVFLSSYLYGAPEKLPTPEEASLKVNNPYSFSKKLAEEACKFYADFFGVKVTILRPFNIYGPAQSEHFLIPSILNQVSARGTIHVKDLEPKRDYVYIDDLIDAMTQVVDLDQKFNIFNIGTGVSHSVSELIDLIQQIHGTNLPVQSSCERRPEEILDARADITRIATILGWSPKWSLKAGLQKMSDK